MNNSPDTLLEASESAAFSLRSLPSLLRAVGAATLLISVSIYLFQGWGQGSDLTRYFLLLAHTLGLASVGIFCSQWLKEQKGARLLLMITLVFISANFAIIGGFVFSIWGQPATSLHGAVTWVISNTGGSMLAIGSALVILAPLSYLGFRVMARSSSKRFSLVFLISNFMLLIPIRDEFVLAAMMLTLLSVVLLTITKARAVDVTLATREGFIARLILFVPLCIMLGRNMMHSVGDIMPLMLCAALYILMRHISLGLKPRNFIRKIIEFVSIAPLLGAAGSMASFVDGVMGASNELALLAFIVTASGMLFELSARASSGRSFYSILASLLLTGGFMLNLFGFDSDYASIISFVAGLGLLWFGYASERRAACALGLIMSTVGVACFFMEIFHSFDISGWFSLAGIGIGAIILGSYIEKRGEKVKCNIRGFKHNLSAWGY